MITFVPSGILMEPSGNCSTAPFSMSWVRIWVALSLFCAYSSATASCIFKFLTYVLWSSSISWIIRCSSRTFCNSYLVLRLFEPIFRRWAEEPLDAKRDKWALYDGLLVSLCINQLTANIDALLEGLENSWVHFNIEVMLLSHIMIAVNYSLSDPIAEGITNDGICYIAKPSTGNLVDISLVWYEEWSSWMLIDFL